MIDRLVLDINLYSKAFRDFYFLKEELIDFCSKNGLPVSGGKLEISDKIAYFLDTGKIMPAKAVKKITAKNSISDITEEIKVEAYFVCLEKHRAFF